MKIKNIKQFNGLRALFSVVAIIMVFTAVNINLAYAQDSVTTETPTPTPTTSPVPDPTPFKRKRKHSDNDLKDLKDKISELLITVEVTSDAITSDANSKKRIKAAKDKLAAFTLDDMDVLRDSIDPAEIAGEVEDAKTKVEKMKPGAQVAYAQGDSSLWRAAGDNDSAQSELPGIADPDAVCKTLIGMGRAKLDVIIAANAVYIAAKILDIALNRGCNQVVVAGVIVLGAGGVGGGNASLACIVSDGILFAAEQVKDKIASCDVDFTERSVDAAVARMGTIHNDLASSVTNDNTNATNILNNDNTNKTTITTAVTSAKEFIDGNATTNKNTIVADALANKNAITGAIGSGTTTVTTAVVGGTSQILSNDNTNRDTVVKNDNGNKDTIIANANANKVELIRLKIAVDLSSTDGSVLVGVFMLPAAKGGYLELVRAVVEQAITELAGSSASQANSLLAQGDASKNASDYKNAYSSYRKAYKVAVK
ncbi:MAG: hypothetical protein WKF90_03640 [Pyrinomonadaceae bacterium]